MQSQSSNHGGMAVGFEFNVQDFPLQGYVQGVAVDEKDASLDQEVEEQVDD